MAALEDVGPYSNALQAYEVIHFNMMEAKDKRGEDYVNHRTIVDCWGRTKLIRAIPDLDSAHRIVSAAFPICLHAFYRAPTHYSPLYMVLRTPVKINVCTTSPHGSVKLADRLDTEP